MPTITHTATTISPMSGAATDFTSAVTYTLDDTVSYTVNVEFEVAGFWWGGSTHLYWASADGSHTATVVSGLQLAIGVAVDQVNGYLYYSDDNAGTITRSDLNGANGTVIVNGTSPAGLALDVSAGKLYWADVSANAIMRADLDGSNPQTLNTDPIQSPINLALDPANNRLFFITYNTTHLGTMAMSGGADTTLLSPGGQGIGVVIDVDANKMYFSIRGDSISRCDLDGRNLDATFITGESNVHGLALGIANNKIYWATTTTIRSANLADGSNKQDITDTNYTYVPGFIFVK